MNAYKVPLVLCILMLMSASLAVVATPTHRLAEKGGKVNLEAIVPTSFGGWKLDPSIIPVQVSPDVQAKLDKIYDQTLARTYVNGIGQRIMLSIAYGGDQSDAMQVHRPEICYAAQGFQIIRDGFGTLVTDYGTLPVKRLFATMGRRQEPITYWITIGDRPTYAGIRQKLTQLAYGLSGTIPDGMLVRVSSLDSNEEQAYKVQDDFVRSLLAAIDDRDRTRFTGQPTQS